jgi:flavin-dependent dehydrogenase
MASQPIAKATLLGEVDVVIVGAGTVGSTMANLLSLKDSGSRPGRKWQR